jgi:signal transduction histidine kinase
MRTSSELLLLHVEDILGYAQLKAGKFIKNIQKFNVKKAVEDIVNIQRYQADSKEISIETMFYGFNGDYEIESDEKRLK